MLERDYIMRLIQEFMAALERMLEKPEIEARRKEIQTLYDKYVGPYAFYHTATVEEALEALEGVDEEHRIGKIEMLAELCYNEARMFSKPESDMLLDINATLRKQM
jgi:predicted glycosyl hydrolase (DUF1957 family)